MIRIPTHLLGFMIVFSLILSACSYQMNNQGLTDIELNSNGPLQPLQLTLNETGVFEVSFQALQKFGWSVSDFEGLTLSDRDKPIPIWIYADGQDKRIRFFVPPTNNPYTQAHYFRLTSGSKSKSARLGPYELPAKTPITASNKIRASLVIEKNLIYEPLFENPNPWLWMKIVAGANADLTLNFPPGISRLQNLQLALWTESSGQLESTEQITDHKLKVGLSGSPKNQEFAWNGRGIYVVDLDPAVFQLENNQLSLQFEIPSSPGSGDVVYLDSIQYSADYLMGSMTAPIKFQGSGDWILLPPKPRVSVLALRDGTPKYLTEYGSEVDHSEYFYADPRMEYYIFDERDIKQPNKISLPQIKQKLFDPSEGVDYLIIGGREFEKDAQPLLNLRTNEGFKTLFIDAQIIIDQFNDGYPEPQAIRNFLNYTWKYWSISPKYVLLLGRYSNDPTGRQVQIPKNLIPSSFIYTQYGGWTVSDSDLADLDRDGIPDISIGRIPIDNDRQLRVVIAKLLHIQQQSPTIRDNKLEIFFDPSMDNFETSIINFSELASTVGYKTGEPNQESILDALTASQPGLIAYFGHGSLMQLAAPSLLNSKDISKLSPTDRFPTMVAFTCLVGYFAHPKVQSLMEILLLKEDAGISAAIAPTSLGLPKNLGNFSEALAKNLGKQETIRIGDLLRTAQASALSAGDGDGLDLIRTFIVLGDPAMKLPSAAH